MARWTGTWLEGPGVTLGELRGTYPGSRLGLPESGAGSVATFGSRLVAFAVDVVAAALVGGLVLAFVAQPTAWGRQGVSCAVLALEQVVLVATGGRTLGMRLVGLTVLRLRSPGRLPGVAPAVVRTVVLLVTLGLAGLFTRDGRGVHDLVAGTAVVRR